MIVRSLPLLLAGGPEETTLRFKSLPPLWLLFMVILPAICLVIWWIYRRESGTATPRGKRILAAFRVATILLVLALLFQPYAETSVRKEVKGHLVVLVDTSASMEFVDAYGDAAKAQSTSQAAGLGLTPPSAVPRLDLVKGALTNPALGLLSRLTERFHVHAYTFDADTSLLFSSAEAGAAPESTPFADRVRSLRATGAYTMLGDGVAGVIEEFRLRDEPLAGIVILTDGRQNGGALSPLEAARRAATSQPRVPLFLVGVGDPDLPKNIHVANLSAREVVLLGDEVAFDFTVTHKGFAGQVVTARLESLEPDGEVREELDLRGADVVLGPEDEEQQVRVTHRFRRPGDYALRVGVPVQRGEKIENDNSLVHPHLTVVDKRIKVLFVDGYPRWEYRYLKVALTRDTETVLAHVLNLASDPEGGGVVQPFSSVPGWGPIRRFPATKEELYEYDVVIFGDVDWKRLGEDEGESKRLLSNLKDFVDDGGGFVMIAGMDYAPRSYRNTPIVDILPVVLSLEEETRAHLDATVSFPMKLTQEGRESSLMMLEDDPESSRRIWEEDPFSRQFWYYPVERAKTGATVLAVHPNREFNGNKFGPHVLVAAMPYGDGKSLFVGVDELWRLRWSFGDRYHYRFYGEAIRLLSTFKLLGGNRRFKIFTDRPRYFLGDPVKITAKVYDRDFNPATDETQTITIRSPDRSTQDLELRLVPDDPGLYTHTVTVNQEGTYLISADVTDEDGSRPSRLFEVEYSTEEMRNPLIDLETMEEMAKETGGAFLPLYRAGELPEAVPPKTVYVSSEIRSEDLWDETWVLFAFTGLLAAEWLLRKRYRLL